MEEIDITGISFDSFVSFMFDRPVPAQGQPQRWYWKIEATFDPARLTSYYVILFSEPRFLLDQFSRPQLEQGFWAIPCSTLNCSVRELIWMDDLDFDVRAGCVRAMYYLFERLFSIEHLETSAHMWWDALCFDWECGNRSRDRGGEDQLMQDVMFETLSQNSQTGVRPMPGGRTPWARPFAPSEHRQTHRAIYRQSFGVNAGIEAICIGSGRVPNTLEIE